MENRSPNPHLKKKPKSEKHLFFNNSKSIPYSASKRSNRNSIQRSVRSLKKYHQEENNINGVRNEEDNNKNPTSEILTPFPNLNSEIQFIPQEFETNNIQHNSTDSEVTHFLKTTPSYKDSGSVNEVMQTENNENAKSPLNLLRNQGFKINCEESVTFPTENVPEFCNSQTEDNLDDFQIFSEESNNFNPFWGDFQSSNIVEEDKFYPSLNSIKEQQNDLMNKDIKMEERKNFKIQEFCDSDLRRFDTCQSTNLLADNLNINEFSEVSPKQIQLMFQSNKSGENSGMSKQDQRHEALDIPTSNDILKMLSESNSPLTESSKELDSSGTYGQRSESLNAETSSEQRLGSLNAGTSSAQRPESPNAGTSSEVENSKEGDDKTSLPGIILYEEDGRPSSERNVSRSNPFSSCDESAAFANFVACQLRHLPLGNSLLCQNAIIQIIIDERRRLLGNQETASILDQEKID